MASVDYGQSYTDKKTQGAMMRFLKQSNKLTTGSKRIGKAKPRTQLNKDSKPKNDYFDNPRLQSRRGGGPKGSELRERTSEKPLPIKARYESQQNNYKPTGKKATGRPKNTSKVNPRYK